MFSLFFINWLMKETIPTLATRRARSAVERERLCARPFVLTRVEADDHRVNPRLMYTQNRLHINKIPYSG